MQKIHKITCQKDFVSHFPGDQSGSLLPRQTPGVLYSKVHPTQVKSPKLIAWSDELGKELGISKPESEEEINILAGNALSPTMYPYAACYAGHQFGSWAGQLGDGRAITLGEIKNPQEKIFELQLKGAGPTPYSRRADGRAVLRSSVREYLMSEAMHYLGVPTTRALSLVSTGEGVLRDMFYDGNAAKEPGAIVMRVAPCFLRFGNFEMLAARQETENLKNLIDWTIHRFFPHLNGEDKITAWFSEVVERTATLMVEWLRVGFVHGVMNTDNMSILGLTIDYGPFSFLDDYDQNFTPNTTDLPGRRYAFGNQASIAHWNLSCLAGAIAPMFSETDELKKALENYTEIFYQKYFRMMAKKLGLVKLLPEDKNLILRFEETLSTIKPDMAIFYQRLIELPLVSNQQEMMAHFHESFYQVPVPDMQKNLLELINSYQQRLKLNDGERAISQKIMKENNPRFILRNYLLHQAIEALENGNDDLFKKLESALKNPYAEVPDQFCLKRPDWASQKAGCSMLSCSS
jgi:serine/tyrosine/threonine adenylyltransferase